jgi:hypothetical protein
MVLARKQAIDFSQISFPSNTQSIFEYFLDKPTDGVQALNTFSVRRIDSNIMNRLMIQYGRLVVTLLVYTPGNGYSDLIDKVSFNLEIGLRLARQFIIDSVPLESRASLEDRIHHELYSPKINEILKRIENSYSGRRFTRERRARRAMGIDGVCGKEKITEAFERISQDLYWAGMDHNCIPRRVINGLRLLRKAREELEGK